MRNGFWRVKKVRKVSAPVERGRKWKGRIGKDGKIERRTECLRIKRLL